MPIYEYACAACGVFPALRPMAEYQEPQSCPDCGAQAPRVLVTAPAVSNLSAAVRTAHTLNERSAHEPRTSAPGSGHQRPGRGKKADRATASTSGIKSVPGTRPWMIGH